MVVPVLDCPGTALGPLGSRGVTTLIWACGEAPSVTEWVHDPTGGRERGPRGLARAWVAVLANPWRFFRTQLSPGDQAPGLTFAAVVVLLEESTRLALVPGAAPVFRDRPGVSALLWLLVAVVLVAPAAIHLATAASTLLLAALAPDRGGISETVQVTCYAMAPCVLVGIPNPSVGLVGTVWASDLVVIGMAEAHDTSLPVAVLAAAPPAAIIFGVGFGGFGDLWAVGAQGWWLLQPMLG